MKYFYIPAGILVVLLGVSLWAGQYVERRTDHWTALLEQADEAGRQEDWASAAGQMDELYADWQSSQTLFHVIMAHEQLDAAEDLFAGAFAVCRSEESADFHQLLAQLVKHLDLLAETQQTNIRNIL